VGLSLSSFSKVITLEIYSPQSSLSAKIAQRAKKVNLAKKSIVTLYYKVAHLPQCLDVFLDFQRVQKVYFLHCVLVRLNVIELVLVFSARSFAKFIVHKI
jgi:hypothetical protein